MARPSRTQDARGKLRVFSGSANPALAAEVCCYLGLEPGDIKIKRFADGEARTMRRSGLQRAVS